VANGAPHDPAQIEALLGLARTQPRVRCWFKDAVDGVHRELCNRERMGTEGASVDARERFRADAVGMTLPRQRDTDP